MESAATTNRLWMLVPLGFSVCAFIGMDRLGWMRVSASVGAGPKSERLVGSEADAELDRRLRMRFAAMRDQEVALALARRKLVELRDETLQWSRAHEDAPANARLAARRRSLLQLEDCVRATESSLREMRASLVELRENVDLLRARRTAARIESRTLDLVSSLQEERRGKARRDIAASAAELHRRVRELEMTNDARRSAIHTVRREETK